MSKQLPSANQLGQTILHFIRRYHVILFTLTVVVGVSVAVFLLNRLITESNTITQPPITVTQFDQETINKINSLNTASNNRSDFSLPPGRVNPFIE